jgi:hypothetical protein
MIMLISICGRYSSMHSIFAFCHICVCLSMSKSLPVCSARDCMSPSLVVSIKLLEKWCQDRNMGNRDDWEYVLCMIDNQFELGKGPIPR